MANESAKPVISKGEMVTKVCLIVSVVVGTLIIVLAFIDNRNVLSECLSVITIVALQWLFYLWLKSQEARRK